MWLVCMRTLGLSSAWQVMVRSRQLPCAVGLPGPSDQCKHCPLLLQVEAAAADALAQAAANKAATPNPAEAAQKARAAVAPQAAGGKLTPAAQAALDKAVYSLYGEQPPKPAAPKPKTAAAAAAAAAAAKPAAATKAAHTP
jgi:hypothetical protein